MPMTSKERVLAAFARQEPDRVPINYMANRGIDRRLKAHFGLAATDDEGLRQRLGADFLGIWVPYIGPRLHAEIKGRFVEPEWGDIKRWISHGAGGYWECCDFPLEQADEEIVARWPVPSPDHYDYAMVHNYCTKNRAYAVHIGDPGVADILNSSGQLFGIERVLTGLMIGDTALLNYLERRTTARLETIRRALEAAKGAIDFLWMGEDLGTQRGPIIGLDLYRQVVRPFHQRFVDLAESFDIPVMIHCCGSSSWAFDDFVAMGIRVVDTLQPEAADMAPAYLKSRYGDRLAFHGCISTAGPVSFGTVDEVRRDTRQILEVMMPGGGYCLSPTHLFQDNSPIENIVTVYDTARVAGIYSS